MKDAISRKEFESAVDLREEELRLREELEMLEEDARRRAAGSGDGGPGDVEDVVLVDRHSGFLDRRR